MRQRSWWLYRRLGWRLALVLLCAIGLAAAVVGWRAVVTARGLDDTALQSQVAAIGAALSTGADGRLRLDLPPDLAAAYARADGTSLYLVTDRSGGALLSSDPATATLIAAYLPKAGLFRVPSSPRLPQGMLGYVRSFGDWRVAAAQSSEQSEALVGSLLTEFFSTGLVLLAGICAVSVLIAVLTVRQGLRPVWLASAAAASVDPAHPGLRLPEAGLPGEVAPLVAAVNQALARLEAALGAQRRFVGDAAHTLRTPLAVLTARLDSLETLATDALRRDVDRMTRLIEQMLHMARLDGTPLDVSQPVDLRAVAVEAIGAMAPLALRRGVELALIEPSEPVRPNGNHAALVIALTNLIENAIAYAPSASSVEVVIASPACLAVLDRGPGVAEAERGVIFERFGRGHAAGSAGAGLGLAIVSGIAAAHRGSVQVVRRDGGGAAFELRLGS